ncbi:MAG: hypothetical protein M3331_04630 [Actinomycetota bacterium]|nr:hypothetical protein [Actinomycetota bacterium]
MATSFLQDLAPRAWAMVRGQHGVIARRQLLDLGLTAAAIRHRLETGRLHAVHRGVYAVGRPELSQEGWWMAAVLAGEEDALLSHQSMAEHCGFRRLLGLPIEITVPSRCHRSRPGLIIHRSDIDPAHVIERNGIPGVSVVVAMAQIAPRLPLGDLERAINQADALDLIDPDALRCTLDHLGQMRGVRRLREGLDRRTFAMSRSELERRFRPIARRAGLPKPETCVMRNGWEVDFLWRGLGLVVETDSLRYHRTPAQQARDRLRDQAHQAAGDTPVRFTHSQVRYEPARVERTLRRIAHTLRAKSPQPPASNKVAEP